MKILFLLAIIAFGSLAFAGCASGPAPGNTSSNTSISTTHTAPISGSAAY